MRESYLGKKRFINLFQMDSKFKLNKATKKIM